MGRSLFADRHHPSVSDPDRGLIQLTDNVHGTITLPAIGNPKKPKVLEKLQLPAEFAQFPSLI
jgi:hypothetical protein